MQQPLTIQSGQGSNILTPAEMLAASARSSGGNQRTVDVGFDPITGMKINAQQAFVERNQRHLMTQMLSGIRRSGSTARSIRPRLRGLGAVDCSTANVTQWSTDQTDVLMAAVLANHGGELFPVLAAVGDAGVCWFQHIMAMPTPSPDAFAAALNILTALQADGFVTSADPTLPATYQFLAQFVVMHGLTAKRAVKLANCGLAMNKANGWSSFGTTWPELCPDVKWYENPLYLGAGAAVIIGAVWFATRKKKAG
jgi:hypothetical protein